MGKYLASIALWSLAQLSVVAQENISGVVTDVIDGNTIEVQTGNKEKLIVILAGIDCPELMQDFGDEAAQSLKKLSLKKQVSVEIVGKDRKGNNLAIVLIHAKTDPRISLLKDGRAWTKEKDPDTELEGLRVKAQAEGKGLWKTGNPVPPWIYRRQQSMLQPKSR
jgi:micrococcal nuclease